ncbi:glycoside hydrolase family 108 protein [Candidatus Palauibacter sp.]|uniref:glycoside hydrolase family 108 protein n=1 Tax=Candidatus Palauibacter sp. TaxID=3101350 RepID=UPI003CC5E410
MTFRDAVKRVLEHEGGHVHDPDDRGGETNFGISRRAYPEEDIRGMTAERAAAIYERDYWPVARDLPIAVRGTVFDMAVNAGRTRAVRLLQDALNQLGHDVAVDGVIGPETLRAVRASDPLALLHVYTTRRVRYYARLAGRRGRMRKFLLGWVNRALGWVE